MVCAQKSDPVVTIHHKANDLRDSNSFHYLCDYTQDKTHEDEAIHNPINICVAFQKNDS